MKNLGIKIISISIILLFCLSPLGAIDLNQGDNATHINIDNDTDIKDIKDINNTIDVVDVDKNKTVNDTSIEVDKDKKDIKKDIVSEKKSLNDTNSSKKLKNADAGLSIEIDDVYGSEWPVVKVRANESLDEYLIVQIYELNGARLDARIHVVNGEGTLTLTKNYWTDYKLLPGTYTATLIFDGDDTFNPSTKATSFTVYDHKLDSAIDISVPDVFVDQKPVIKVKANEGVNGNVEVKLKSNNYSEDATVNLVDGEGNVTLNDCLHYGDYSASVCFNGTDRFNPSNDTADFTVKRYDPHFNIRILNVFEGEWPYVQVWANDTIEDYMVVRVDTPYDGRLDAIMKVVKGQGTLYLNKTYWGHKLEPGNYTASIIFEGDDTYNPSITTTTFEVFDHKREVG